MHVLEGFKLLICCIRVIYELLKLLYIVGIYIDEYYVWAEAAVFTHVISDDVDDWDRWFLGRAPGTRETLADFLESCRVARHS